MTDAAACDFPEARRLIRARTQTTYKPTAAEQPGPPPAQPPADGAQGLVEATGPAATPPAKEADGAGRKPKPKAKPGKKDEELVRHFVSSLGEAEADRERLAGIIRSHWSCETRHWERDTQWREDACLIRDPNAACALALLRTGLQALLRRAVKAPLPVIFEDVANHLELGLSWLKQRNFRL